MIQTMFKKYFLGILLCVTVLFPFSASAAQDLEVAGWIPYWRADQGIRDAKKHLDQIDALYPFVFTLKNDGSLKDLGKLSGRSWKSLFSAARSEDIEIIPTVMTSDGYLVHTLLSDSKSRRAHIKEIVKMVERGRYDGVGIDYETKRAETKDFFSLFLKELKKELHGKILTCTIEARTPPESLYKVVPDTIAYSNDYKEIGKHCDRIDIMAYDQQRADLKLNEAKAGEPYMPVADADWVEKVVALAVASLPKEKLVLGIASYGNHYAITVAPDWYRDYRRIGALNVPDILDVAKEYKVKPSRNRAGEMSFSYIPKSSHVKLSKSLKIPKDTKSGNVVAARALAHANKTGEEVTFNYASYSDAGAMEAKIDLAKKYGLLGIAFFKIDGEEDQAVWKALE